MSFIADLHIHSRHSMATSRSLSVRTLAEWAAMKGINVLGSGDFTHPLWLAELEDTLVQDDHSGLHRLKDHSTDTLFCLQTEISCIYKKDGKTRRVHNLIYLPDFHTAKIFSSTLEKIGRLTSDGRPILGIDSRDLLEMALESSHEAVLIPAHVWTPWYSVFGAKSGFDSLEDCFGDLTDHIFALETGLSSDPPMNRLWSALDNYALVSNSDAHSGSNLGREANLFAGTPSWEGIFTAIKAAAGRCSPHSQCSFLGTFEFFPEEGKYHYDGHRNCGISLTPAESRELGNICPVCGKKLTMGVLHRIMDLADRHEPAHLEQEPDSRTLVPLREVVAEIVQTGMATKTVTSKYNEIVTSLGPELDVLCSIPIEEIKSFWEPLGEAVQRIRTGKVQLQPGFDGQYGKIRIFEKGELPAGK